MASETATPDQAPEEETFRKTAPKQAARTGRVEIRCKGGRVLKVDAGLDPLMLQGLIRSVEEA
ncbi:hypothetical protein M0H32_22690 [Roseibium sp. CAU 1639]|uniref:Transposase n=1 Tax=Roseibium sediminicola TaxID=2933272 RepID=A0ABT0H1N3_9HYPH|nr:hypothetical protein [Roseibium sp. CAU 1639]MCK7614983.1 hypothetical protein [Roseibium sp. CAU 1639]